MADRFSESQLKGMKKEDLIAHVLSLYRTIDNITDKTPSGTLTSGQTTDVFLLLQKINTKVNSLATNVVALPNKIESIIPKSYADAAKSKLNVVETREEAIVVTQKAIREEQDRTNREKRCVVKHIGTTRPDTFLTAICTQAELDKSNYSIRPLSKSDSPIAFLVTAPSKEDTLKFMAAVRKYRQDNANHFPKLSARPDYSANELAVFRQCWAKAFTLNSEAKKMIYTVRDLEVVKMKKPLPWVAPLSDQV